MTNTTKNTMEENTMKNEMEYALIDTADGEIMFCGTLAECESETEDYGIDTLEIVNKAEYREQLENRQTEIREEIYNYFDNNSDEFTEVIEELDSWNGYLGDERCYPMEEINEFYSDPLDAMERAFYGHDENYYIESERKIYAEFNPNRPYFYYNGYGNLVSCSEKDYIDHLDDYTIDEIIENWGHLNSLPVEVDELIEELENIDSALNELD